MTPDKSALEKLRCHSAGGAKTLAFPLSWIKGPRVLNLTKVFSSPQEITYLVPRKSDLVIICRNSCQNSIKVKLGQVWVGTNIAQNHFHGPQVCVTKYVCQCTWKKVKLVKFKSVQTLLRIACLSHRKSYMVIISANSLCKVDQTWN